MSKNRVVVFTKNNARIITGETPKVTNKKAKFLVNPKISHLKNVPLHFWKLDGDSIKEMTPREKVFRLRQIRLYGIDNNWQDVLFAKSKNSWNYITIGIIITVSAVISHILTRIFNG